MNMSRILTPVKEAAGKLSKEALDVAKSAPKTFKSTPCVDKFIPTTPKKASCENLKFFQKIARTLEPKKIKQLRANYAQLPKELIGIINKNAALDNTQYTSSLYGDLVKYMGLDDIAPKSITFDAPKPISIFGEQIAGGFNPITGKIAYSDNFFILDKAKQADMLAHELTHAKQATEIVRTVGVEEYAKAWAQSSAKISHKHGIFIGGKPTIEKLTDSHYNEILPKMKETYKDISALQKYSPDSKEAKKGLDYLEATRQYDSGSSGIINLGPSGEQYRNNVMEVEAYSFGNDIAKKFEIGFEYIKKGLK